MALYQLWSAGYKSAGIGQERKQCPICRQESGDGMINHTLLRETDNRDLADVDRYRSASMEALRAEIRRLRAELEAIKTGKAIAFPIKRTI